MEEAPLCFKILTETGKFVSRKKQILNYLNRSSIYVLNYTQCDIMFLIAAASKNEPDALNILSAMI